MSTTPVTTQPVLFVSHGAPTLALDSGAWGAALLDWAGQRSGLKAIVVVSAHWEQAGPVRVMSGPNPETLHDFGGFPDELYQIRYPAPGDPALAARVAGLIRAGGLAVELDSSRPLDHGAWVPVRAAFPAATLPVIQVSLPVPRTPQQLFQLGRLLSPLREEGVLLVGSGGIVHNLRLLDWSGQPAPAPWALDFEAWVADRLEGGDAEGLFQAAKAPGYAKAVPTPEHFDPIYFALGAGSGAPLSTVHTSWSFGSLSLRVWAWGA
jgi:4,5-DOPA dioxygenase extradiol